MKLYGENLFQSNTWLQALSLMLFRFLCPFILNKCSVLVFFKGNFKFFLCIHDDGTVPGNRFADRFSGNEKKTNPIFSGSHSYFLTVAVEDNRFVPTQTAPLEIEVVGANHFMSIRVT